jgi:hypothetical protein
MSADDPIELAVDHVADGKPVDWQVLAARVGNDDERERLECLRILEAIAGLHRSGDPARNEPSPVQPGVDPGSSTATPRGHSPGETWGRYTLLEKVGSGTADARLKERLLREGRALAKVRDPNVVNMYGVESHRGRVTPGWIRIHLIR